MIIKLLAHVHIKFSPNFNSNPSEAPKQSIPKNIRTTTTFKPTSSPDDFSWSRIGVELMACHVGVDDQHLIGVSCKHVSVYVEALDESVLHGLGEVRPIIIHARLLSKWVGMKLPYEIGLWIFILTSTRKGLFRPFFSSNITSSKDESKSTILMFKWCCLEESSLFTFLFLWTKAASKFLYKDLW